MNYLQESSPFSINSQSTELTLPKGHENYKDSDKEKCPYL